MVVACSAISHASRQRAERRLPDTAVLPVHEVAGRAELLLIAVPDAELASVVSGLAATHAVRPGTIVAHTSGANGIAVLSPLTEQGCIPLAIHPAMTFTGADEDISRLPDTCFGITAADDVGYAIAQSLVLEIGGEPFRVREDARTLYHAALAHASNHVVTVVLDAVEALRAALWGQELLGQELVGDEPGGIAERVIGPLARASLENALQRGALRRVVADATIAPWTDPRELSPSQAAARLGTSTRTVQRWIASGRLPARRVGGRWRVAFDALDAFERADGRRIGPERPSADAVAQRLGPGHPDGVRRQSRRDRRPDPADVPTGSACAPSSRARTATPPVDLLDAAAVVGAAVASRRRCRPPGVRLPQRERRLRRARSSRPACAGSGRRRPPSGPWATRPRRVAWRPAWHPDRARL